MRERPRKTGRVSVCVHSHTANRFEEVRGSGRREEAGRMESRRVKETAKGGAYGETEVGRGPGRCQPWGPCYPAPHPTLKTTQSCLHVRISVGLCVWTNAKSV